MNVCKVPDMRKDMEYKYITEDSKTRWRRSNGVAVSEISLFRVFKKV